MTWAVLVLPLAVLALGGALRAATGANRRATIAGRLPRSRPARADRGPAGALRWRRRLPPPPRWLEPALADAGADVAPATAWAGWLAALVTAWGLALVVSGILAATLVLAAGTALPRLVLRSRRGRAAGRIEADLPFALESIARSLRSGASVRQAIEEAAAPGGLGPRRGRRQRREGRRSGRGPLQAELALVADQSAHGTGLVEALEALAARRPSPGMRLAVAALCLGVDTGGAQARAVDGVASTLRERLGVEAEVRALSSQARMSALVIGLAPLGFAAFAAATDPRTSDFLLHTSAGLAVVTVGLLLDGAGWMWMQRLCRVTA